MTDPTPTLNPKAAVPEAMRLADQCKLLANEASSVFWRNGDGQFFDNALKARNDSIDALASLVQPPEAPAAVEVSRLAWRDVLSERHRQISKEGWSPEHDDEHDEGDLSLAGAVYAVTKGPRKDVPPAWPWEAAAFKPRDWRANLVRAGALVLAELERLDRLKSAKCIDPMCACHGGPCAECPEGQDIALATMASTPASEPMLNGLTEAQTDASASVQGLSTAVQVASGEPDWMLRTKVADLLHLLEYANIDTPTLGDAAQALRVMADLRGIVSSAVNTAALATPSVAPIAVPVAALPDEPQGWTRSAIFQAAKACAAHAFDQPINNSSSQKFWQSHADNLNAIVDAIDASPTASAPAGLSPAEVAKAEMIGWRDRSYVDSTPHLHVGDSAFEDWFQAQPFATQSGVKQISRDSYAAGMGDPLVIARDAATSSAIPAAPGETGGEL